MLFRYQLVMEYSEIRKKILKAKSVIFTHTGFHPHLHVNSKSDFCLKKKR